MQKNIFISFLKIIISYVQTCNPRHMLDLDCLLLSGTIPQDILRFLQHLIYLPTLNLLLSNRRPFYLSTSITDVSLAFLLRLGVLCSAGKVTDSKINHALIFKSTRKPCGMMQLSVQGETRYLNYSYVQIKSTFIRHYIGFSYCPRLTFLGEC